MHLSTALLMLLRLLAAFQVVLGIGFWTGHWYGLVPVHRGGGVLFVLTLWAIAVLALGRRGAGDGRRPVAPIVALLWGVGIAWLGFMQVRLLPGEFHWIVRVTHLAIAMAAMPIAERVVRARAGVDARAGRAAGAQAMDEEAAG